MTGQFALSRRRLLAGGGAVIIGFALCPAFTSYAQSASGAKPVALSEVDSFLAIDSKGLATIFSGKVDIGTGLRTALTQIAAEELDLPLKFVTILQGDTLLTPDQGPSSASNSVQIGGMQIRQAAAAAKAALLTEAAALFGAQQEELKTENGTITGPSGKRASYAALVGGKTFSITLDPKKPVFTKAPKDFSLVGRPIQRVDIPDKVTGRYTYMQDFSVPGMLHGRVIRPPALGAQLQSVDESSVKSVPGIVKVVRQGNFLAIVATTEWAAISAAQALRAAWSQWEGLPEQTKLFDYVRASKIAKDDVTSDIGASAATLRDPSIRGVDATYDFAIHTHGSIGPSCAKAYLMVGVAGHP
jgi:nicotinate dehydrogenase subunit B